MSKFFPLNQSFGAGWADDPDDANLVDRALRRIGVMRKPLYGSTNPVRDIQAGLQRFQRDNNLAIDGFMRTEGPTAAKLAERLDEALGKPAPGDAGNPWPWRTSAATDLPGAWTTAGAALKPSSRTPVRPMTFGEKALRTIVEAKAALDGKKTPRPLPKPPPPRLVPNPVSPEESRRIAQAVNIVRNQTQPEAKPDHGVPFGDTPPTPGRKPKAPARSALNLLPPVDNPVIRSDPAGDGYFGASRGNRTHQGIDIIAEPGTEVRAPASGIIQLRKPYSAAHRLHHQFDSAWIELPDGRRLKFFYVDVSDLADGQHVEVGEILGRVQDRAKHDLTGRMKNHFHFEVHENEKPIDPTPYISEWFNLKNRR